MRHDQRRFVETAQKVFEQDLRAQVQEVGRFVQQQQVRFMQQERRQLDARLPPAGQLGNRAVEILAFQFELTGNFTTFPLWFLTVAHQKIQRRLAGQKRIVLSQIADLQLRMLDDFTLLELFLA